MTGPLTLRTTVSTLIYHARALLVTPILLVRLEVFEQLCRHRPRTTAYMTRKIRTPRRNDKQNHQPLCVVSMYLGYCDT